MRTLTRRSAAEQTISPKVSTRGRGAVERGHDRPPRSSGGIRFGHDFTGIPLHHSAGGEIPTRSARHQPSWTTALPHDACAMKAEGKSSGAREKLIDGGGS